MNADTICAVATPPGRGGVGVIRISGPHTEAIALSILGCVPTPRVATFRSFKSRNDQALDDGLALFFPAPHSFTGENVLELQGHGSPVVLDLLLEEITVLGARLARPGEFSERAFLNDKLDLVQAEAIADLIDSTTHAAARAALRSLRGEFSTQIHGIVRRLINARMFVEAAIDFPEEEIDFLADSDILQRVDKISTDIGALLVSAHQGSLLRQGATIVIAGQPNAGKSSLLNALAGYSAAIVTDIPGTTRDVIKEQIQLDGLPLNIIDTAGLRDTADVIEQEGVRRAWDAIGQADMVMLVLDDNFGWQAQDLETLQALPEGVKIVVVYNKIDLTNREVSTESKDNCVHIAVSAKTGTGIPELVKLIEKMVGFDQGVEADFIARRRHLAAIERGLASVRSGRNQLVESRAGELLAEELRQAQLAFNEITGEFTTEDLLGEIFSTFCIGK